MAPAACSLQYEQYSSTVQGESTVLQYNAGAHIDDPRHSAVRAQVKRQTIDHMCDDVTYIGMRVFARVGVAL
jgi:hypothetical protein